MKILAGRAVDNPDCGKIERRNCESRVKIAALEGCPAKVADYATELGELQKKLDQRKTPIKKWSSFVNEIEKARNQNNAEMCKTQLKSIQGIEAQIIVEGNACQIEPAASRDPDLAALLRFRDCAEAKAKSIGALIVPDSSDTANPRNETAQLHAVDSEITKIWIRSIFLVNEFRGLLKEAGQSKCWLQGVIRNCNL